MEPHLSPSLTPQHKNITESQIEIVASLYFLFLCLEIYSQDIDKVATPSRLRMEVGSFTQSNMFLAW